MRNRKLLQRTLLFNLIIFVSGFSSVEISAQKIASQKLTAREIAQQTLPSTVSIVMGNDKTSEIKSGSGFFVAEDIIVTNLHVIKNSNKGVAKIVGQDKIYEVLGTLGIDEQHDLALLKIKGSKGKPLKLDVNDLTVIGDDVYAVGNPQGLEGTFSQGIVSSIRKTEKSNLLQITAPISEGSSGGAVLNNLGEVIGIAVGGIESGQSLNFAVPVIFLRLLLSNQTSVKSLENNALNDKTQSSSKVIPKQTGKSPNTKDAPKKVSSIQYKLSDSKEENLFGSINLIKENVYSPSQKFGEWELGEPVATSIKSYNLDGNLKNIDSTVYTEKGISGTDFSLYFFVEVDGGKLNPPVKFKKIYFYDYPKNVVTYEIYGKCDYCSNFELFNKIAVKYNQGEESRFDSDGKLFLKTTTRKDIKGNLIEEVYYGEGNLSNREITYRNNSGEIKEYWLPSETNKNKLELSSKTMTTET